MSSYEFITDLKIFGLEWHLSFNIWCHKDVFEIHPLALCFYPFLNYFHDKLNVLGEFFCSRLDRLDVSIGKSVVYIGQ
jgi:hypothetical protein